MGSDMYLRDLYLPAGTGLDLAAAKTTVSQLCRTATIDGLRILLDEDWISDDSPLDPEDWTDQNLTVHAATLRAVAERRLHRLLDEFAASLQGRDVARFRFDNDTDTDTDADTGGGLDAYITGGVSSGGGPTDAYDAWDIVLDTDRFPDGWCDRIGAACGLLHPRGAGPATFHAWAAPAPGEEVNP